MRSDIALIYLNRILMVIHFVWGHFAQRYPKFLMDAVWLKNLLALFHARGYYEISEPSSFIANKISYHLLSASYLEPRRGVKTQVSCLVIPDGFSLNKKDALVYIQLLPHDCKCIVLVRNLGPQPAQCFRHLNFEHLKYEDICCPKMEHVLVPNYRLVGHAETKELEKRYGEKTKFPKMVAKVDAMARYLDFQVGDIVEVAKKSPFSGISYRWVISENQE